MSLSRDNYVILSVPYKVREVPSGDSRIDDNYGKVCWAEYTIYLASDGPWEERVETLIHETMHIITRGQDKYNLAEEGILRTFSEVLVDTLLRNGILTKGE